MGKTTLARVVYGMFSNQFEACSFIANVREVNETHGLLQLQKTLLNELLLEKDVNIGEVDNGVFIIKNRLRHKKILLVLDDVNELEQLMKLAGENDWFGPGSRVIITTRDEHLLKSREVDGIYEAEGLDYDESFHLFNLKAFKKEHPTKDFLELSQAFVNYANGLPLAIEVLGSSLFTRSIDEWNSALGRLKEIPNGKILNGTEAVQGIVLKLPKPKNANWNPEAFSKMKSLKVLEIHNVNLLCGPKILPNSLRLLDWSCYPSKSLPVSFQPDGLVELRMCSSKIERLWQGRKSLDKLKVIQLENSIQLIETPDFTEIPNLEELVFEDCINLREIHPSFGDLTKLTLLNLKGCKNLKSLPSKFGMESLEILILSGCSKVKKIPEFGRNMECVRKLYLDGTAITKLPTSIENLTGLASLNLRDCKNLVSLPSKFGMESLEILILSGCSKVKKIPEFGRNMECVRKLYLDGTAITKLPTSIENLTGLASLNLRDCKNLVCVPSTIFNLKLLKDVDISGCSKFERLPENLGNAESVEELDVSGTAIRHVPSSIGRLKNLKRLAFKGCKGLSSSNKSWYELIPFYSKPISPDPVGLSPLLGLCSLTKLNLSDCNLKAIPNDIGSLFSLEHLNLDGNKFVYLPESLGQLSNLKWVAVNNCTSLRSLSMLPLNIEGIGATNCISLEMLPDLLKANEWFTHQSMGDEANIKEPSNLCNEWMGIALCVVFCSHPHHQIDNQNDQAHQAHFRLRASGNTNLLEVFGNIHGLSDHLWLLYLCPSFYNENNRKLLWESDANGLSQIGIKIETLSSSIEMKKFGFRMVYKKDIEDLNRIMAQCSNNNITPYDGIDVLHHNFDNSTVAAEGNKIKRSRDEYDGAGPSGEGSSNDVPHAKRIERLPEFKDCDEEQSDWQKSSESDREC
uniref:ADP-ribosyl cyclase/cyclic ADP-ribose hydrolase n=1 Tax=Fagus sylvatica TaxID=28930 RepID=A0A2N9I7T0_FAGSY